MSIDLTFITDVSDNALYRETTWILEGDNTEIDGNVRKIQVRDLFLRGRGV